MNKLPSLAAGYNQRSLVALGILGAVYLAVFLKWPFLIDIGRGMDWLLGGIWAFMTLTLIWNIDAERDIPLACVAFVGGFVIEWWGTTTHLWVYWTSDRPPLWIIPAWPVAALAIDRISQVLDAAFSRDLKLGWAWWTMAPIFVAGMTAFLWPRVEVLSSQVIIGLMVFVVATGGNRRDVLTFLGGAALGIFLEYWGTSRFCWTYYTREVPPPIAAVAHGFASVAFWRGVQGVTWVRRTLRSRSPVSRPA